MLRPPYSCPPITVGAIPVVLRLQGDRAANTVNRCLRRCNLLRGFAFSHRCLCPRYTVEFVLDAVRSAWCCLTAAVSSLYWPSAVLPRHQHCAKSCGVGQSHSPVNRRSLFLVCIC